MLIDVSLYFHICTKGTRICTESYVKFATALKTQLDGHNCHETCKSSVIEIKFCFNQ